VSDKLPGMAANGVHSSIGVLIRSVSRLDVTTMVLDVVLSSLDLAALIMSSSSFFLHSFLCIQGHLFYVHCFSFSHITFSKGRFVVQVFSSSSCFSSTSFLFISWYLSSTSSTFLACSASFSLFFLPLTLFFLYFRGVGP
jgi:hypothetical protein